MKMSLSWLSRYVDINVPVQQMCDKMVMSGFEIESMEDLSKTMSNVVVARILKIVPHPDSDHLLICQLDVGKDEPLQIITGASNVFEGALVPAALHDSYLPDGTHIKKGKLRGLDSFGMMCSGGELNLTESDYPGAEVNGILILKDDLLPGTDMREVLGLFDWVIDFKITANRPDCQSVLGVAKEIAVALGTKFEYPVPRYEEITDKHIDDYIKVTVKDGDLCPRYCGRMVENLRIKPSPDWMQAALKSAGMRPINNIVDITNFVMLETGQPLHAFDYRDINGKEIIVRPAYEGEKITTLDGKEHTLNPSMLVIADAAQPSCLAGIMGGLNSEIKDDTKTLFLECAKFRRDSVRRTCRALGVATESSARYQRGVDINNVEYASERALALIAELDAGDIVAGTIDVNSAPAETNVIKATPESINALLGLEIPADTMVDILNRLGLRTTLEDGTLTCLVPSIRSDVEGRADLAEEVMRIYGYDHIVGTPLRGAVHPGKLSDSRRMTDKIKARMVAQGAREIATYSFISKKQLEELRLPADDERRNVVELCNPLGEEYSTMRTQLISSMLTVLSTNYNHSNESARLFEISKRFVPKALPLDEQPLEIPTMSVGLYGAAEDFYTLKGVIESIFDCFGITAEYSRSSESYLHPGRQASATLGNTVIATFGEVHPSVCESYKLGGRVYVGEIYLENLLKIKPSHVKYRPMPRFPAVTRDFAMLCDAKTPVAELQKAITSGAGKLCEQVKLFDVYEGKQIPEGKKSVAFTVTLRSAEGTLDDEQIERVCSKIIKNLDAKGANLRQ